MSQEHGRRRDRRTAGTNPLLFGVLASLFLLAPSRRALAQEEYPKFTVNGVADVRGIETGTTQSWLDGGLGKTRYGGVDGKAATLFRLSQSALVLGVETSEVLSVTAQVNFDPYPDNNAERQHVDLVTAYISYRPELTPHTRLRVRAGLLIPPVSLENDGLAWTATRTLTPSAANTWIGEEIRATGVEAALAYKGDQDDISVFGAAFGDNDAAGTLLAFRGWAFHDRVSGIDDQLPLAPLPLIQPGGDLAQAPWVQPFTSIDGRVGFYEGAAWKRSNRFHLNGIYYDNRGNGSTFDGFQYAWNTHFADVGASIELPFKIEVLGQHMWGRAREGWYMGAYAVDAPFQTTYGLLSIPIGPARISVRYDRFSVDSDGTDSVDSTAEHGNAWTGALLVKTGDHHRLAFEVLRVESDRPDRANLSLPTHADEVLGQASFQVHF